MRICCSLTVTKEKERWDCKGVGKRYYQIKALIEVAAWSVEPHSFWGCNIPEIISSVLQSDWQCTKLEQRRHKRETQLVYLDMMAALITFDILEFINFTLQCTEPLFIFYLLSLTYKQTIIYLWISVSSVCVDVAWECRSILLGWPCDFPVAEQLKHNCRAFHSAIAACFHFIVRTMGQTCVAD